MNVLDPMKNFVEVQVSSVGYDDTDTAIVLASGERAKLPDIADGASNGVYYNATDYPGVLDDPNREIVRRTADGGGAEEITVTRAQEGTSASTKNNGGKTYKIIFGYTQKTHDDIDTELGRLDLKQDTLSEGAFVDGDKTKLDYVTITQAVDLDTIESRVNELDAAVVLQGAWDASAGTFPGGGTAQAGHSYIVSVGGTVNSVVFNVGDRIIAILDNASTSTYASNWLKLDYTDLVSSVAGKTGVVTLEVTDLTDAKTTATGVFVGSYAGNNDDGGTNNNTVIGVEALATNVSGTSNTAVGKGVLSQNTASGNTAVGYLALAENTIGADNHAFGSGALSINETGNKNVSIGRSTLLSLISGSFNIAIGDLALRYVTGSNNIGIGHQAGDNITTGAKNIIIGTDIDAPSATTSNQLNIGNIIFGTGVSGTGTTIAGNIGIGLTAPATKLDVNGAITSHELSSDPSDPVEGANVTWQSDGTGSGDDGDIMMKITAGGVTKTTTIVDFSAI